MARLPRTLRAHRTTLLGGGELSLRVGRHGDPLATWETIGGCGAGGANGTGVKWIGRNTTGGMFQLMVVNNVITIPPSDCPPITMPSAMPRRSPTMLEITSAVGTKVEKPSPRPSTN